MPVAVVESKATHGRPTTHRQAPGRQGRAVPRPVENEATSSRLVEKAYRSRRRHSTHAVGRIGGVPSGQIVWNTHVWDT